MRFDLYLTFHIFYFTYWLTIYLVTFVIFKAKKYSVINI